MKKLFLIWLFSNSLDGFSQTFGQTIDTSFINNYTLYCHDVGWPCGCSKCRTDTIPSKILISHKPPSFGHSIDGYCVYQGDRCTGKHLRYWHRRWVVIGPEYTVWGCKRVNTPKK